MTTQTTYVTLEEATKHFKVSASTFRSWLRKKLIPEAAYIRLGSVYRFDLGAVETALKNQSKHKGTEE